MKLLLIADRFDRSALCEASWWTEAIALHAANCGWQVDAACVDPHSSGPANATFHPHGLHGFESAVGAGLATHPDLVYAATPGPFSPRLVEALASRPLIVDVMTHWPLCPNDDLMWRPAFHRCELRYPADACGPCAGLERLREMESRLRLTHRAAAVVVHARFQAERLARLLDRSLECVTLGADPEVFRPEPAAPHGGAVERLWQSRRQWPRVLMLGPPTQARGIGALLDVIVGVRARVPNTEFVIAGDDPANPRWQEALLVELGRMGLAADVRLLGRIDPADWPAVIAASDVGIAPGWWDDPCGLFLLQAFACGVPVVASGRGIHAELLQHGSGMLASPQSPAIFADRVAMLLSHHEARLAMGDAARLHAVEHHDQARSLETIERLLVRMGEASSRAA